MIAFLNGKIINKGQGFVIINVNGVGYKVFVNLTLYAELAMDQETSLYTHHHIREDALDLYGFRNLSELDLFELLLSISGIGPKSALGVLAIASVEDIKESIAQADPHLLTKVSGIGKKTAERVVLELKDKIGQLTDLRQQPMGNAGRMVSDELDALIALGYSVQQAREALREVDKEIKDSGERIREALRRLGK